MQLNQLWQKQQLWEKVMHECWEAAIQSIWDKQQVNWLRACKSSPSCISADKVRVLWQGIFKMNLEKELAELHGMLFALQTTRGNLVCQWQKFYYIFLSALKKNVSKCKWRRKWILIYSAIQRIGFMEDSNLNEKRWNVRLHFK